MLENRAIFGSFFAYWFKKKKRKGRMAKKVF